MCDIDKSKSKIISGRIQEEVWASDSQLCMIMLSKERQWFLNFTCAVCQSTHPSAMPLNEYKPKSHFGLSTIQVFIQHRAEGLKTGCQKLIFLSFHEAINLQN